MQDAARLDGLRQAFERLSEQGFPDDSGDEQSSQLHAELAEYDGYVAGRITTLLAGGRLQDSDLKPDNDLRRRLATVAKSHSLGAVYLAYLDDLDSLLIMARNLARNSK